MLCIDFGLNLVEIDSCFNFFWSVVDVCFLDCLLLILWGMDFKVNFLWNLLDLNKGFEEKLKIKYVILFVKNIFFLILNSFFFW